MQSSTGDTCDSTLDSNKSLICFEAIKKLPNGRFALKQYRGEKKLLQMSFLKFMAKHQTEFDEEILIHLKTKLNVVKFNCKNEPILIYDNRYLKIVKPNWPEVCWIMNKRGKIIQTGDFSICIPFSADSSIKNLPAEQELCELLQLKTKKFKNPKNFVETKKIVKRLNLENDIVVWYHWKIGRRKKRYGEIWLQPPPNKIVDGIDIEAFLRPNYTIGFRGSTKFLDDLRPSLSQMNISNGPVAIAIPPNEFQKNAAASVCVQLQGLNELFNISALSLENFKKISTLLGKMAGAVWIELDVENNARFATYKDFQVEFQVELSCQQDWNKFFDFIFERRNVIMKEKETILAPAIAYLKQVTQNNDASSPFQKCLKNFEICIKNSKILVYSKNDFVLHSLKTQFCYFMSKKALKGFRGIGLTGDAKNNLSTLKTPELTFANFFNYLEMEEASEDFLPEPVLLLKKNLKKQPPQNNTQSTLSYVKERGLVQARQLYLAWQTFGEMFLNQFHFDIFSIPFSSLSGLSFKSIWTLYTRSGGWYQHGLEKSKHFDRDLLRKQCKGGFSFSAQLKRNANEPLFESQTELCKNIQGFDIRSSYGFACSELSAVKGFCTSFKWNNEKNNLECCDTVWRFNSFEFLSVFYTIHYLETNLRVNIKTVYSNFHQFGFFSIKRYPLDLVVVTAEGHLRLFNFDGEYAHGCRAGCPSLASYVQNKSRKDLEAETEERDNFIEAWCEQMNRSMKNESFCIYQVKTSCHDSAFFKSNLLKYFKSQPVLKNLISHYFRTREVEMDELIFCSENLTFLAIVEGFVPNSNDQKPLFVQDGDQKWKRAESTDGLFLSRDYLQWLMEEFNFQVTKIQKVWVYKKCKLFNVIFKNLIEQRALDSTSQTQKDFLKNVVNFCSGYFGFNEFKAQAFTKNRLVTKIGQKFDCNTEIKFLDSIGDVSFLVLRKQLLTREKKNSNYPLPIYCLITEFGKMTLSKAFCHFEKFLMKEKRLFAYSNIDNLILILSTETLEDAVCPALREKFLKHQKNFFGLKPGQLKKEFEFVSSDKWKFVTSMAQNYAVLSEKSSKDINKNNGWNASSSEHSYTAACKILKKQKVSILQERRVDKMLNTKTVLKNLCF